MTVKLSFTITMNAKLLALFTSLAVSTAYAAVTETPEELQGTGDFNGDGRPDLVIADKLTGVYRVGYGQADGSQSWSESRPSGIENVSGLAIGRILHPTREALAFTAPAANRVNILDASDPAVPGQPTNAFLVALGPNRVVALDIGFGGGNTAHDDLFVTSLANNQASPYFRTLLRSTGASFSDLLNAPLTAQALAADRVRLKTTGSALAGALLKTTPNLTFTATSLAGLPSDQAVANNLPDADAFVFANFDGSLLNQFLFYKGGGSNLTLRPVVENPPAVFTFSPGATFTFDAALRQVVTVPGTSDTRLLIIFGEGETAGVYSFDGVNAPSLVESFTAEPGETFTGAAALGGGNLSLFSGTGGRSARFQNWNRSGNGYAKGASGGLPTVDPMGNSGNVFLFKNKPFVHPAPTLMGTLNAADWSSTLNLSNPNDVRATAEKFGTSAQGLDNPTLRQLGPAPAGTAFGLPNQIQESFSLLSFSPAIGKEVVEVNISPDAGHYPQGIKVTLTSPEPAAEIRYRLNGTGNWTLYSGVPLPLFKNTTVSYHAQLPGSSAKTVIRSATYTFDTPPSTLDSDGDGVPDFVELGYDGNNNGTPDYLEHNAEHGKGLDAIYGAKDTDGDGYSDLAELLAGTNPYTTNSVATNAPRADELAAFDWQVTPWPLAGAVPGFATCSNGTVVSAFNLHGGLLGATETLPTVVPPAYFSNLFADANQRLYMAATEPHFGIRSNNIPGFPQGLDLRMGREMFRMLPVPQLPSGFDVNYIMGGGSPATEANNWIAAAQAAQAAIQHPVINHYMTYHDTLVALMTERKIGQLLVTRGLLDPTNQITLFPFRPQDAGRINPAHSNLLSLETNKVLEGGIPDPAHPGHKMTNVFHRLNNGVAAPPSFDVVRLRDLAAEIYRISAVSNNVAPGKFPSPVDTLRTFIETGVLHSNYLAATTLTDAQIDQAANGVVQLLASVSARPTSHGTLKVRPDSFSADGCTILEAPGGALKSLVLGDGTAFKFPEAFQLAPDSQVDVHAYTDLPPSCGADTLDVITLTVTAIPAVSSADADGDLLADAWECLFLAFDPNGDNDSDGVKNLQEFLDGTDPLNALSQGVPVNLDPPLISIEPALNGQLKLGWFWPELYAGKFNFQIQAADAIGQPFTQTPDAVQNLGGGYFQILLPNSGTPMKLFRVQMSLK